MTTQELIADICRKELECGCYEVKIDDVSIYSFVRLGIRQELLERDGHKVMQDRNKNNIKVLIPALIKSLWHFSCFFCTQKHYEYVFYPFARLDKVGGQYLDKFTDPIIDESNLTNYIILDRGRAGVHPQPRVHSDNVIYVDLLQVYAMVKARLFYKFFIARHKSELKKFSNSLRKLTGEEVHNSVFRRVAYEQYYSKLFERLLKLLHAKTVIGPTRAQQMPLFVAAHRLGIQAIELQHGVTFGETTLYSGFQDPMIVPDFFLAFGDNKPADVYGINEKKIVNVGFALFDYIERGGSDKKYGNNDVLVVSDPTITETMISIVMELASDNPQINFYFRPHPHESLTEEQINIIENAKNVFLQDRDINIIEVLHGFKHIVGENSTVLYEALSMQKKVGRLHYKGLSPKYLLEKDKNDFWQISNQMTFEKFIAEDLSNNVRSIYSKFDKTEMMRVLNIY